VIKFKYLETTLTNKNSFQEASKGRLKTENTCNHSVQNHLSSSLLPKNITNKIYSTIILPVIFNGCETWLLTLREEHRLKMFENKVLRRICGLKRDEVREERRSLGNEEHNDLYSSLNITPAIKSRSMRWVGHVESVGKRRGVYRISVVRPE